MIQWCAHVYTRTLELFTFLSFLSLQQFCLYHPCIWLSLHPEYPRLQWGEISWWPLDQSYTYRLQQQEAARQSRSVTQRVHNAKSYVKNEKLQNEHQIEHILRWLLFKLTQQHALNANTSANEIYALKKKWNHNGEKDHLTFPAYGMKFCSNTCHSLLFLKWLEIMTSRVES